MNEPSYPILFRGDTTDFTTNGMGRLTDCISSYVNESLNGGYECTVTYPKNGKHAGDIRQKRFLLIKPNETSDKQAFRIYKIEETSDGQRMVVRGQHRSYDLSGYPVKPFKATGITSSLSGLVTNSMVTNPYTAVAQSDMTNETSTFELKEPRSFRACLGGVEGSVLQKFKCEYEFDNLTVKVWKRRGSDNGVTIRYGKNLEKFTNVRTTENAYNGCVAFWKDSEEKNIVYGDVYQPNGAISPDAGGSNLHFPTSRIYVLDASSDFEEKPTKAQLTARAQEYYEDNDFGTPYLDTVTVSFVPLWQTEEYKEVAVLERVSLGDTVHVIYGRFDFATRVVEYTYDSIKGRYTSITLGTKQATFSSTIAQVTASTPATINGAYATVDEVQEAIDNFADNATFLDGFDVTNQASDVVRFGIEEPATYTRTFYVNGFVSTSATTAVLYVPLGVLAITNISVSSVVASVRTSDGGYLGGAENSNLTVTSSEYIERQNVLKLTFTKSSGWDITNNTPLCGTIALTYTIV